MLLRQYGRDHGGGSSAYGGGFGGPEILISPSRLTIWRESNQISDKAEVGPPDAGEMLFRPRLLGLSAGFCQLSPQTSPRDGGLGRDSLSS